MPLKTMEAFKIAIKLYVQDASFLTQDEFVPIFHSWIQSSAFPDHILIDVADYAHVKDGPGTLLVAHEANYYIDKSDGRLGLTYSRKQLAPGSLKDRLKQAITAAIEAASKLESDPRIEGRIKFNTDELLITLNDRLLAPNTPETLAAIEPLLREAISEIFNTTAPKLERILGERALFQVRAKLTNAPADLSSLQAPSR
ncbi:MAG TPA: hypothetical protein VF669_03040 [Tepidisphaeraceae bacterium]